MTNKSENTLFWILSIFIIAVGLLFAFIGLSEFYNVNIAGEISAYPFGSISDNPWYYQSASVYANYNLASGLIFLAVSLLTVWASFKKNKKLIVLGACLIVLFFITALLNSTIQ
ncbi:MAG: hypothetical protein WAR78_16620 [Ferruginibacter sp.]